MAKKLKWSWRSPSFLCPKCGCRLSSSVDISAVHCQEAGLIGKAARRIAKRGPAIPGASPMAHTTNDSEVTDEE